MSMEEVCAVDFLPQKEGVVERVKTVRWTPALGEGGGGTS
jgi:hypothetical protein